MNRPLPEIPAATLAEGGAETSAWLAYFLTPASSPVTRKAFNWPEGQSRSRAIGQ